MFYVTNRRFDTVFDDSDGELNIPGFVNPVPVRLLPSSLFDKEAGYAAFMKLARRFRDPKGIIVNTFDELESYALGSLNNGQNPRIYAVGPVIDLNSKSQSNEEGIIKWLDNQPESSVVFLCFGSMGSFDAPQLREISKALERSGHRFLWSVRVRPTQDNLIPTPTDPKIMLGDEFLQRTKGRGVVCGWVPQVDVLAHKAIGGFVSHCGWNSILESLWHGVPIVTWPLYAEQRMNAYLMVKQLGLAKEMRLDYNRDGGDLVMANEIERAIKEIMEGHNEIKEKVKGIKEKSRLALMNGGSSFDRMACLIEDMIINI